MIKVVAFDFDGTIVDSAHECYIMTLKALERMGEPINESRGLEEKYNKLRSFIKIGDDFYAVMKIIQEKKDFRRMTQEEFDKYLKKYENKCKEFEKHFYDVREEYMKKDLKKWIRLNRIYPGIISAIKKLAKQYKVLIVTAKDKKSLYVMLKSLELDVEKSDVIGKEFSKDKSEQIKYIKNKLSVRFDEIVLVEDSLKQIMSMAKLGIKLVMVSWGYNNDRQRIEARELGIQVIDKADELEEIIKSFNQE